MKVQTLVGKLTLAAAIVLMTSWGALANDFRTLKLSYPASLKGKAIPAGEYKISWQTHSPNATVTVKHKKDVIATVEGKWEDRDSTYDRDAVVYATNPDGSRTIIEIRFTGLKGALVFGDSPSALMSHPVTIQLARNVDATKQKIQFLGKPNVQAQVRVDPVDQLWSPAMMTPSFRQPVPSGRNGVPGAWNSN